MVNFRWQRNRNDNPIYICWPPVKLSLIYLHQKSIKQRHQLSLNIACMRLSVHFHFSLFSMRLWLIRSANVRVHEIESCFWYILYTIHRFMHQLNSSAHRKSARKIKPLRITMVWICTLASLWRQLHLKFNWIDFHGSNSYKHMNTTVLCFPNTIAEIVENGEINFFSRKSGWFRYLRAVVCADTKLPTNASKKKRHIISRWNTQKHHTKTLNYRKMQIQKRFHANVIRTTEFDSNDILRLRLI